MIDYNSILSEIQQIYLADSIPWIIGFSGGKDSTTVLQMVFQALSKLPKKQLAKEIHIICNDTLVENPAIVEYSDKQLTKIEIAGKEQLFSSNPDLFKVAKLTPKLEDTFWVNLIGKGYPSPNRWFRWCTERLKINPTSDYIKHALQKNNNAIIVLGTRKAESTNRAASMEKYNEGNKLRNHRLPNVYVYAPIADLSNNEIWAYLLQVKNPWGTDNKELLRLYGFACDSGECPFFIETGTQSCGKSRFGCWVCTVVDRDKSMENFVENGHAWMKKLLDFRNWLYEIRQQSNQYVPKRINSNAKFGPFLMRTRQTIFKKLMSIQSQIPIELISPKEIDYVKELLELESNCRVQNGLKKFIYEKSKGEIFAVISDFDVLNSSRLRLGSIYLKGVKLVSTRKVSSKYLASHRILYYSI